MGVFSSVKVLPETTERRRILGTLFRFDTVLEVRCSIGLKHFVRRMLKSVDLPVRKLCRVQFGKFRLGSLAEGEIQELTHMLRKWRKGEEKRKRYHGEG